MPASIVLGLGYGDEGKGLVTDWLVPKSSDPLVVRFSGGHQAGHTVVVGKTRHVFASFGSGTLRGAPTYWSKYCTVDPVAMRNELHLLRSKGVYPKIYVHQDAPVTTPYEVAENRMAQGGKQRVSSSVGVGYGATIAREEAFRSFTFGDLHFKTARDHKLQAVREYYGYGPDVFKEAVSEFWEAVEDLVYDLDVHVTDGQGLFDQHEDVIFEGSQGLLLDQRFGFFPHVTRANTGTRNALELWNTKERGELAVYLVTRAYQTRHGDGPMNQQEGAGCIKEDPEETNKPHPYQGKFRRALLDTNTLRYGIMRDEYLRANPFNLMVTCLDHLRPYAIVVNEKVLEPKTEDGFLSILARETLAEKLFVSSNPDSSYIKEAVCQSKAA